jgi:hypothetical protein
VVKRAAVRKTANCFLVARTFHKDEERRKQRKTYKVADTAI